MSGETRARVAAGVAEMRREGGDVPGLAALLVGDDPASAVYVRNKRRACSEAGMFGETFRLPESASLSQVIDAVERLNHDPRFHGIIVQLPLPSHVDEQKVIESIRPDKDVDGLHPFNMGRLVQGRPDFVPGTPAGIQELLVRNGIDPAGQRVVICGRSNIVGLPLANLLTQRQDGANATVTVCHTRTRDLPGFTQSADILVAAMGRPAIITADMVKEGAVVIDVGITRVDDAARRQGYRLQGDVDFAPVAAKAAAITPVPGGVGPMTVAMLLVNTLKAARLQSARQPSNPPC